MPQSATTDVNGTFIALLTDLRFGRKIEDEKLVRRSIMDINGLLPPELRIEFIRSNDFDELLKPKLSVLCPKCNEESVVSSDTICKTSLAWDENSCDILGFKKHDNYVVCKVCNNSLFYDSDKSLVISRSQKTSFDLTTMPTPPMTDTFLGQSFQRANFWKWVDFVTPVLMDKVREFRNMFSIDAEGEDEAVA